MTAENKLDLLCRMRWWPCWTNNKMSNVSSAWVSQSIGILSKRDANRTKLEILWAMLTKWYPPLPHVCMAKSLFCSGKPQNHSNKKLK